MSIEGDDPVNANGDEPSQAEGEFEFISMEHVSEENYEPKIIAFDLEVTNKSTISFRSYVRDVHLTIPATVELGKKESEFRIGPSVFVNANRIRISADELVVEKAPPKYDEYADPGVTLEAQAFESYMANGIPNVYASEFTVSWPDDNVFPWRMYAQKDVTF